MVFLYMNGRIRYPTIVVTGIPRCPGCPARLREGPEPFLMPATAPRRRIICRSVKWNKYEIHMEYICMYYIYNNNYDYDHHDHENSNTPSHRI